jgi:membrane protein
MTLMKRLNDFFTHEIWEIDVSSLDKYKAFLIKALRLVYVAIREFTTGELTLRAMSLVYTTLLSIVPLLAISFSVLKAFGVHNQVVEPFLLRVLAPLGPKGEEITVQIIGFVENVKVGVLSSLGLALLFYTVISVIQKIENSFNHIWRIKKSRSFARRFSDYLSIILVSPVLMFSAMALTASLNSAAIVKKLVAIEPFGTLFYVFAEISPYLFVIAAFTFLYVFLPNTKVKLESALVGGIIAGILWETAGWGFASFVASSTKYAAIYSGFAILILFLIWLYVSWLILLVGAQISFYHQYPRFFIAKKELFIFSIRFREKIALLIMVLIGYNFYHKRPPWTMSALVNHLRLPLEPVQDILTFLEQNKYVLESHDEPPVYVPARDIETITIQELFDSIRRAERGTRVFERKVLSLPEVEVMLNKLDDAIGKTFHKETIKSLVISHKDTHKKAVS